MDIFQFLDPYVALQNYYQKRKKYEPTFSYTVWSEELGLRSSSTLRMMVNGKKRLSSSVVEKFLILQFKTKDEQNYFRLLLIYAHASTRVEKESAWSSLSKILSSRIEQEEALDFFTYVSDILNPKLLAMLSFDDQIWTISDLAYVLNAKPTEISEALSKLEKVGMAKSSTSSSGEATWTATQRLLKVSDQPGNIALKAYHNACLDEAKEAQELPLETRKYKSLLLPLTEDEFQEVTNEINTFAKQLITKYQSNEYQRRRLFKLNLNYFPVSKKKDLIA